MLIARLGLYDVNGDVLVQSDGGTGGTADALIDQHVQAGRYYLAVSAEGGGGDYRLTSRFVDAIAPLAPLPVGTQPDFVVTADVNGDGIPDLIIANEYNHTISVLLGNGDATFQNQRTFPTGSAPFKSLVVADVNGDGKPDIIGAMGVMLGNGDGAFQRPALPRKP